MNDVVRALALGGAMIGGYVLWQQLRAQEAAAMQRTAYVPPPQPSQYDKLAALTPATSTRDSNPWADILLRFAEWFDGAILWGGATGVVV